MRPWFVNDPTYTPGYVPIPEEEAGAPMESDAFAQLLDSAAQSGDSAFIGVCLDIGQKDRA
jgi:hypothetical protein